MKFIYTEKGGEEVIVSIANALNDEEFAEKLRCLFEKMFDEAKVFQQ